LTVQKENQTNKLIGERSPYLLQHAHNPVDWYPWGPEAFEKAAEEDKLVFLSIGYSTCHWCHIMERESFEDDDVARALNEGFISVKVDREERPDIDSVYMRVCQMMTGGGGWPLTVIMAPDRRPFFAGTYFPKNSRHGRPGLLDVLEEVLDVWRNDRGRAEGISDRMVENLESSRKPSPHALGEETLRFGYLHYSQSFDSRHGGFGTAPKFPMPHSLMFLLRYWRRTGEEKALTMVERTLRSMRMGGVYDHLGHGVHRYSTDIHWLVPHFEKMLYDQALLSTAYTEAYQATGDPLYMQVSREILDYVLTTMVSPEGGFYSAEDADSEGVEGKFYVWTEREIRGALTPEEADAVIGVYNVSEAGNYEDEATRRRTRRNILHLKQPVSELAEGLGVSVEALEERLSSAREKLMAVRSGRAHPLKDDKILAGWNGLMIAALAKAGRAFNEPRYVEAAAKAVDFVFSEMVDDGGCLLRRYRDGDASILGFLDDYAFLVWGLLELYEASYGLRYLKLAVEINGGMLERFWDTEQGGLYLTSEHSELVLVRSKETYDGAIPSGNSVAYLNLLRLARMTGDTGLDERASELADHFSEQVAMAPSSYAFFLVGLDIALGPSKEVIIVGKEGAEDTEAMLQALGEGFLPNKVVLFVPDEELPQIARIAEYVKEYSSVEGKATAYICVDFHCELPTTSVAKMLEMLK
jgi:hypothetical protein